MLSRRRFFGAVAGAAVAAPAAVAAAPAVAASLEAVFVEYYLKPALVFSPNAFAFTWPKIGDTIMVRRPVRFIARDGGYSWMRDDYLPVTLATPDDLALYRERVVDWVTVIG